MTARLPTWQKLLAGLALLTVVAASAVWWLNVRDEGYPALAAVAATAAADEVAADTAAHTPGDTVARGAYLARAGNCQACHSARGGPAYAGGLGIATPFGTVYSTNLTPDAATGLGSWSPADFWRALHNGRSRDGRLLYPAFPYTNYTRVSRGDSDALFAYLGSLAPVSQAPVANTLRFPFDTQAALAVWRALYFTPGVQAPEPGRSVPWNRGAYLVGGLGHCSACHAARDALGGNRDSLSLAGGLIPMQNWYAPSLASSQEAGVAGWPASEVVQLLQTGISPRASVNGPMAEVVLGSTQYLADSDLFAMADYLKSLPDAAAPQAVHAQAPAAVQAGTEPADSVDKSARLYSKHCAQCHGEQGQGVAGAYPLLAGNRAVTMPQAVNLVQVVLHGGFAPATAGNPRPYGMPPFVLVLSDAEIASVVTHLRTSWGNQAAAVSPLDVAQIRARQGR